MFGVVPKRMWASLNPPDDQNMCTWAMRALLVETPNRLILIDTGVGDKQDERFRSHFLPHGPESLLGSLAEKGFRPEQVTDVLLTHLHFDHCGGALRIDPASGAIVPTFPNAVYWSNQRHFDWAMQPNEREKASFLKENFEPLQTMGLLRMVDVRQNTTFAPGIRIKFLYGHTEAMMAPLIETPQGKFLFPADLFPAQWHIPMPYVMAYDVRPLQTLKEKKRILDEAVQKNYILIFEHDPFAEAATLRRESNGRIVVDRVGPLSAF